MISALLASGRRLSMIARSASSRFANARARSTPPASGDTMISRSRFLRRIAEIRTGAAYRWSTGMSKKPWIWAAWRSIVSSRSAPAVVIRLATSLAVIGTRGLSLRSWRA